MNNPSRNLVSPYFRFLNLWELHIDLPVDNKFWCGIPNFDQLTSLFISYYNDDNTKFEQVQLLLDRESRLNSLGFRCSSLLSMQFLPIKFISKSIRQLYLEKNDQLFNDQ